jgi:hypothetical protein
MPNITPGFIANQESEAARQRAAGRQKIIKKTNDPSNAGRGSTQVKGYKVATKQNWARANEEAKMTGAARVAAIQKAKGKVGK